MERRSYWVDVLHILLIYEVMTEIIDVLMFPERHKFLSDANSRVTLQVNKMPWEELVCQLIRGPYATHSIFLWEVKIRLLRMIKPTLSTVYSWQKGIKYGPFLLGIPLSRAVGAYNVSAQDARVSARQIQPKGSVLVSL